MATEFTLNYFNTSKKFKRKVKLQSLLKKGEKKYICAKVNNRLRELTYDVYYSADIEFLTVEDYEAVKIYEVSLRYIVAMAIYRIDPTLHIKFSYNVSRSIFGLFLNLNRPLSNDFVKRIKQEVQAIIDADYPLNKKVVSNEKALEIYKQFSHEDKIEILKYRPEKTVHLYECDGYYNYMYSHMVPSTGFIKDYNIRLYSPGLIIQYPRSECGGKIPPFEDTPKFGKTLKSSSNWAKNSKCDSIASINRFIEERGAVDFINMCECYHTNMLAELGKEIKDNLDEIRLICVAGPSSSGKTTFSNRLRAELLSRGIFPIRISIDNYYLEKHLIPKEKDGSIDLESINALDIDLFNDNISDLIQGKEVTLPVFNFKTGKRESGETIKIDGKTPIIIEGIHALNDDLTSLIPKHQKYKIYISPQAQINIDNHSPISLTNLRLLRRIVRDKKSRNSSAEETMSMWPSVRRGEFRWIYSGQEDADFVFNSLLSYELPIMKNHALKALNEIDNNSPYYITANGLVKFLKYFIDIEEDAIPCNSLMREFIGGSCYKDV